MQRKSDRRWTLLVVPHGSGGSRGVEVSHSVFKTAVGLGTAVVLALLLLGGAGVGSEKASLTAAGATGTQALRARQDVDALIRRANILASSVSEAYDSMASRQARVAATPAIMPTDGWLTSAFQRERVHPLLHLARPHEGIDVTAPMGAEIEAPAAGTVTKVKWEEGYGNMITLDHGYGLVTRYAHCSKVLVARGTRVKRGQKIALVGSTRLSARPPPPLQGGGEREPGKTKKERV